jgi:anthranilate phosphoribosyltransferase
MNILEGHGTDAQNSVVAANAGMALYCANPRSGIIGSVQTARETLESGKALQAFKKLIGNL